MHIHIHHHYPDREETKEFLLLILKQLKQMSQILDDLTAKVEQNTTVTQSAITLLTGLKSSLDEEIQLLKDAQVDTTGLQALSDKLGTNTQALADAVSANTPVQG